MERSITLLAAVMLSACASHDEVGRVSSLVHAQSLESTPSAAKLRYWASPDCINAGKYVGVDYARALERAINKEPSGLPHHGHRRIRWRCG